MKKIHLLIILGLFFILSPYCSHATHLMGGDLMYECIGGNQYRVILKLYRDCEGVPISYTEPVTLTATSDGGCSDRQINVQRESMRELSPICPSQQSQSACQGGNLIGSEEYVYTGTVTLPDNCGEWTIGTSFSYRNHAITNLEDVATNQYDMYLRTTIDEANDSICNASPQFTNPPVPYICNGIEYNYNHQAMDADGDSLAYKLMNPMDEPVPPGDSIPFQNPFSTNYPINTQSGTFGINVNTGMITFTPEGDYAPANDDFMQVAVLTVLVEEYRGGELIGTVMRDIQVVVVDCDNIPPYRTSVSNASGDPSATRVDSNTFRVCAGDSLAFSSDMTDDNAGDILSLTSNLDVTIPGADIRSSGTNPITGTFVWNTNPVDTGDYSFTLDVQDDACPLIGSNSYLYHVEVTPSIVVEPTVEHVTCSEPGSVSVDVTTGPANPEFTWQGYPDSSGNSLSNIPAGTYQLSVEDTSGYYCSFDTTFTVDPAPEAVIDSLDITDVTCSDSGTVEVFTQNPAHTYEYSWDGGPFGNNASLNNLSRGTHTVEIRIQGTTCTDDTSFEIQPPPTLNIDSLDIKPETCSGPGYAAVFPEDTTRDYEYNWNGNGWSDSLEAALPAGNHSVVIRLEGTTCTDDTTFRIGVIGDIAIDNVIVSDAGCFASNGTAEIQVSPPGRPYIYSWSGAGGNYENSPTVDGLAIGSHKVTVTDTAYGCRDSTNLDIDGKGLDYDVVSSPDQCGSGAGKIEVDPKGSLADSVAEIQWNDIGSGAFVRDNLNAGTYGFTLLNPNAPASCRVDTTIALNNVVDPVEAAFSYRPSGSDDDYDVGEPVYFINESQGDVDSSHWSFGDGGTSTEFNPAHTYEDTGKFDVTLEVVTPEGCTDRARKALQIVPLTPCNKAIPNAFSPNGDGKNDDIGILGNVEDVELTIFNRWGEPVFRAHDREERWDGTFRGERAPVGVYPYVLYYTCPEDDVRRREVGQITLIR